jgi:tRNA modification GTPase
MVSSVLESGDEMFNDTIAAIATFPGNAGINIIRLSGKDALNIALKIFIDKNREKVTNFKARYLHYGYIRDENDRIIDEVLISYMKAPNTYTREDIIEINCHGGIISAKKILDTVLSYGCRPAERGEFTKRAFLNGRIDLTQAEAVLDIINSKTDSSHEISVKHLEGRLSRQINAVIDEIMDLLANIEVNIDFPEYDEDEITIERVKSLCDKIGPQLDKLIKTADTGKIFKEGIKTVILGKPNVGKSSLMNFLLNENRAIVTEIPGTTRDTIEEFVNIKGVPLRIIDTAGIRETDDMVERIGVEKALEKVRAADLVMMILGKDKVMVNGIIKDIDVPTRMVNSRTFAPLRFVAENLGHTVRWDETTNSVYITRNKTFPLERGISIVGTKENLIALLEYNSKH